MTIRQCYVCSLPVPTDEFCNTWEVLKIGFDIQYRCPRHRMNAPKQLATIGESRKIRLSSMYGKFGK